jgi:hypothetical protein
VKFSRVLSRGFGVPRAAAGMVPIQWAVARSWLRRNGPHLVPSVLAYVLALVASGLLAPTAVGIVVGITFAAAAVAAASRTMFSTDDCWHGGTLYAEFHLLLAGAALPPALVCAIGIGRLRTDDVFILGQLVTDVEQPALPAVALGASAIAAAWACCHARPAPRRETALAFAAALCQWCHSVSALMAYATACNGEYTGLFAPMAVWLLTAIRLRPHADSHASPLAVLALGCAVTLLLFALVLMYFTVSSQVTTCLIRTSFGGCGPSLAPARGSSQGLRTEAGSRLLRGARAQLPSRRRSSSSPPSYQSYLTLALRT